MKKISFIVLSAIAVASAILAFTKKHNTPTSKISALPAEDFFMMRNYPDFTMDVKGYEQAMQITKQQSLQSKLANTVGFNNSWTMEGPGNIGGRINCVAMHPTNNMIMYVGNATGGIHKTTDGGVTWNPIFDDQSALSVSCIEFEPGNPNTMWVGTGDAQISGYPFIGDGIYKSTDGGNTWTNMGLANTRIITKIKIHTTNPNIIYAATMGVPFIKDNNRGVYKSIDGGVTWQQSLFISDSAGVIDMLMDPQNPDILYAAGWNRLRSNKGSLVAGPDARIYKTTDGGANWNMLTNGLPMIDASRIGLTMSGTNANVIYASYVDVNFDLLGIYKTTNGGTTWTQKGGNNLLGVQGGFGWYFGRIEINPTNDNELYFCAIGLHKSTDGGDNFYDVDPAYDMHADKHDIRYLSNSVQLCATDGGLYKTTNGGSTWNDIENIPNTQFYRCAVNPHAQGVYAGGAQDNGTEYGNAASFNNWIRVFGADGFQPLYNPTDPNIMWAEYQNGGINVSTDGGNSFNDATNGIDFNDRRHWDMQYIMSKADPNRMYTGTYQVYRNDDGENANWYSISGDITDGVIYGDRFHTISCVEESPANENNLYAGTTDGNVWASTNQGTTWQNVTGVLPDRYVSSVKASVLNANTVFVTHTGYKYNDFIPHIHKSINNGNTWVDISGNLPPAAINDVYVTAAGDDVLFVATDAGVYATVDGGVTWNRLGNNMPIIPVYDLDFDYSSNRLCAATFARSMMTYDVDSIVSLGTPAVSELPSLSLYPNPAINYLQIKLPFTNDVTITIYDVKGKKCMQKNFEKRNPKKINVEMLTRGIYFVEVQSGNKRFYGKFLKKEF